MKNEIWTGVRSYFSEKVQDLGLVEETGNQYPH